MKNILAILLLLTVAGCKRKTDHEVIRESEAPYLVLSGAITSDSFSFDLPTANNVKDWKSILLYVSDNGTNMHQVPYGAISYNTYADDTKILISSAVTGGFNAYTAMLYRSHF